MKKQPPAYSAFISYASENREKADDICANLEERGFVCWIAPRNLRSGREYGDEIITGIERSACVVLVLSEAANTSVFVRREVERAVSKHKPIFPVRISEVVPSPALELFVSGTHWLDAWEGDWDGHMTRLAREVSSVPAGNTSGEISSGRLPLVGDRGIRGVHVAGALVLAALLSGAGFWAYARAGSTSPPDDDERIATPAATQPAPAPAPAPVPAPASAQIPIPERPSADPRPAAAGEPPPVSAPVDNRAVPSRVPDRTNARTGAASRELVDLRDELDELSDRAATMDATLDQFWEGMKPLAPRVDMATRQRSLRTSVARSREALAQANAGDAKRYMDNARADLAVLDQFLGR
jgi:hypothetical protein